MRVQKRLLLCFLLLDAYHFFAQSTLAEQTTIYIRESIKAHGTGDYPAMLSWAHKANKIHREGNSLDSTAIKIPYLLSRAHQSLNQLDSAQYYITKAMEKADLLKEKETSLFGQVYDLQGQLFTLRNDPRKALPYYEQSIVAFNSGEKDSLLKSNVHNNIANAYIQLGQYDLATASLRQSLEIKESILGRKDGFVANSYRNLGVVLFRQGRLEKALEYVTYAGDILQEIYGEQYEGWSDYYNTLAVINLSMGNRELALDYFSKAVAIWRRKKGKKEDYHLSHYMNNMGRILIDLNRPQEAVEHIKEGLRIRLAIFGEQNAYTALSYNNLGQVYYKTKAYDKALPYFLKALKIRKSTLGENHNSVAISQLYLANLYSDMYRFADARDALVRAAEILGYDEHSPMNFSKSNGASHLQLFLKTKSAYFQKQPQLIDSLVANESCEIALQDYLQQVLMDKDSRQKQMYGTYPIVERAIKHRLARNATNDFEQAFEISEQNKSRLLSENLRLNGVQGFPGLPIALREKERHLNLTIAKFEKEHFRSESESLPDSITQPYRDSIFDLKQKREVLIREFESSYPEYFQYKYDQSPITITQIQSRLKANESLLEYFVGDSTAYVFAINRDQFTIEAVPLDFPLNDWIEQFREGIYHYWMSFDKTEQLYTQTKEQYTQRGHGLYLKLVHPVAGYLREKLLIIPDGNLGILPL